MFFRFWAHQINFARAFFTCSQHLNCNYLAMGVSLVKNTTFVVPLQWRSLLWQTAILLRVTQIAKQHMPKNSGLKARCFANTCKTNDQAQSTCLWKITRATIRAETRADIQMDIYSMAKATCGLAPKSSLNFTTKCSNQTACHCTFTSHHCTRPSGKTPLAKMIVPHPKTHDVVYNCCSKQTLTLIASIWIIGCNSQICVQNQSKLKTCLHHIV